MDSEKTNRLTDAWSMERRSVANELQNEVTRTLAAAWLLIQHTHKENPELQTGPFLQAEECLTNTIDSIRSIHYLLSAD